MVHINDLPDEVLEFIMSYLPPYKDLEECSAVCKRWSLIVKNVMHYAQMNLNKGLSEFRVCWKLGPNCETTPIITGRFSHSAVMHKNSMFIFGGRSSATTTFNDLWCFDLSKRQWIRQLPMGTYPSPKACATMVNHEGRLILFGGVRHPGLGQFLQLVKLFDELHVYDINENRWTVYTSPQSPPPSAGHSASIRKNEMVIFGGFQTTTEIDGVSNDIWCLNLKSFEWHKQDTSNVKPPPRYGQFQITLDDNHILVLGGCGGPNNVFSDAWLLNTEGETWKWKQVEVRNKKWAATHMWCNPAAKVGSKLVVLGPTPAMPTDFQIIKQVPHSSGNRSARHSFNLAGHRRPPYDDRAAARENNNNGAQRHNNQLQQPASPQVNENISNNSSGSSSSSSSGGSSSNNHSRSPRLNDEAAVRLQRNLQALRNRDDEHLLPKRFDEPFQDRLGMAAFNMGENPNSSIRERQLERLRRMQDKYHEIRRQSACQNNHQKSPSSSPDSGSSSPKRVKRNCIAMFVCDLTNLLTAQEPYLDWLEFKNYGIASGAPERLILSSIVAGKGELIMFGGLLKESLTNECVQVSNSVHFLTVPRGII